MNDLQKTTLVRAINHFGVEAQTEKALEEMGELITELSRRHSSRGDKEKIAEEVADALVMLEQLRIIYGGELVDGYVARKLERLEKKMNGDWKRQEKMMPPGMIVHRSEGDFVRLDEHLKRLQPRRVCLYCKHLCSAPIDGFCDAVCGLSGDIIIGNVGQMTCGQYEAILREAQNGSVV